MQYIVFFYNVALILLFGACSFGFLALCLQRKEPLFFWSTAMFFLFFCDNIIFAMGEFIPKFLEFRAQIFYFSTYLNNLVAIGMLVSFRMLLCELVGWRVRSGERWVMLGLGACFVVSATFAGHFVGRLCYTVLNSIIVGALVVGGILAYRRDRTKKALNPPLFWLLSVSGLLHFSGGVEQFVVLFSGPKPYTYRNLSYELFGLLCAGAGVYYLLHMLGRQLPESPSDEALLESFIRHYRLTPREAELLPLLLAGEDNAAIGEKICVSKNTVKSHTHNIYQKLSIERRGQISNRLTEFREKKLAVKDL